MRIANLTPVKLLLPAIPLVAVAIVALSPEPAAVSPEPFGLPRMTRIEIVKPKPAPMPPRPTNACDRACPQVVF